jgi:hypothetical protein
MAASQCTTPDPKTGVLGVKTSSNHSVDADQKIPAYRGTPLPGDVPSSRLQARATNRSPTMLKPATAGLQNSAGTASSLGVGVDLRCWRYTFVVMYLAQNLSPCLRSESRPLWAILRGQLTASVGSRASLSHR